MTELSKNIQTSQLANNVVNVKDFGAKGDGVTDDTAAIQAAIDSLQQYESIIFNGAFKTNGVITVTGDNLTFDFSNTTFLVGDTGVNGTLVSTASGKIGFLFKQCNDLTIIGSPLLIGQGTVGTTSLAGVVFDNCNRVRCQDDFRFENMSAGRFIINCTESYFGDINAKNMNGLQTFESPPTNNQGSAEVIISTTDSRFGDVISIDGAKPARYLSADATMIDNERNIFGATVTTGVAGSLTAHALALRSSVDNAFGDVIAKNSSFGVLIQISSGDTVSVDRNIISSVVGNVPSTGASVDALVNQETLAGEVGYTKIGSVSGVCGGEFGIRVTSGQMDIGTVSLTGTATRYINVHHDTATSKLHIDKLELGGNTGSTASPINVGGGGELDINILDITSGPGSSMTGAVRYDPAFGSGSYLYRIGEIRYNKNGSAGDYTYLFMDLTNEYTLGSIGNIVGAGTGAEARFGADSFSINYSRYSSSAPPTTGTYAVGDIVYNTTPVASGTLGWVCTAAGTPGTWKTFGAISA